MKIMNNNNEDNDNDDNYRRVSIIVTLNDLKRDSIPLLKPNLIDRPYKSCHEYLDTHFRLLHEELIGPLCENIEKIRKLRLENVNNDLTDVTDFNVYTGISVTKEYHDKDRTTEPYLKLTFNIEPFRDINWNDTKRLISGSLLCLTHDYFETMNDVIIAIVESIEIPKHMDKRDTGIINISVDKSDYFNLLISNKKFIALESTAYFEGLRHTLHKLQILDKELDFPLKDYIVSSKNVHIPPPYLKGDSVYNLKLASKPLKTREENECEELIQSNDDARNDPLLSVPILNCNVFSHLKSTFDAAQYEAFFNALTKQFTVIQGPPGTGKTYVGLRIVQTLLANRHVWAGQLPCPILVICYKNHALDQFLEGILDKISDKIIRIGMKCESKFLNDYRLENIIKRNEESLNEKKDKKSPELIKVLEFAKKIRSLRYRITRKSGVFKKLRENVNNAFTIILNDIFIELKIIKNKHITQLKTHGNDFNESLLIWLSANDRESNDGVGNINSELYCPNYLRQKLNGSNVMTKYEVMEIVDVYDLKKKDRWKLYRFWRNKYLQKIQINMSDVLTNLEQLKTKLNNLRVKYDYNITGDAHVIGMTMTGAAKRSKLIELLNPKIVIVEEAAEVLESHLIASLPSKTQHLILIGDHKQLRPITNVRQLTTKYNFDISLFERMIEGTNKLPYYRLTLQHRMRECISRLLKEGDIYDDLRDHPHVKSYPQIPFIYGKNMFFLNHIVDEDTNWHRECIDSSRSNSHEAKFIIELSRYFLLRGICEENITILTTYAAQLTLIKDMMKDDPFFVKPNDENENLKDKEKEETEIKLRVRVSTVDGYQGEENDIILISFVRSNKKGDIGFLETKNRVNVALSRARHGLYCIGNFRAMKKRSKMWAGIVKYLEKVESIGDIIKLGCECTEIPFEINMPRHFGLLNRQIQNKPKY